jgi:hypothetical protein
MIDEINRASIKTQDIKIKYEPNTDKTIVKDNANQIGKYPYVYCKGLVIQANDIISLLLYNSKFMPEVELQFRDPTNKIVDPLFPIDDEILSIFIQSNSELLMPVRMDFKITYFNVIRDSKELNYLIKGVLNVNNLFYTPFKSYNMNSFDLFKKISEESELGFYSNIKKTEDKMIWINPSETNVDFIQYVLKHSFLSVDSFLWAYIDFYYNLVYIDIEKLLNENIKDKKQFANKRVSDFNDVDDLEDAVLTNHPDKDGTSLFINKFNILNSSTEINLENGYHSYVYWYNDKNKVMNKILLDNISYAGKDNDQIIMKGKIGDFTTLYNNNINNIFMGKVDPDNIHEYYLYSEIQNTNNLKFLQKLKMKVVLNNLNFNLYRFQLIDVKLYKTGELDDSDANNTESEYDSKLNKALSGSWLITGINYTYSKKDGNTQEISLVKREITLSI